MTSSSRRALPWLLSIGAHFVALAVVGLLFVSQARELPTPRLDISLVGTPGSGRA